MYQTDAPACPHLGLSEDPGSHMAFTSPLNCCHASRSAPAPVKLEHQNDCCLGASFSSCPVYQAGNSKSFPRALRERTRANQDYRPRGPGAMAYLLPLAAALVLLGLGYWLWSLYAPQPPTVPTPFWRLTASVTAPRGLAGPSDALVTETPALESLEPSATPSVTPFPSLTPTFFTETPSRTPTVTPSRTLRPTYTATPPSPTATFESLHGLDMPIGRVQKFVIHRVLGGENLNGLAEQYKTSIEAILQVNYTLAIPIQQGAVIVLPLEIANPQGLPVFEPYEVQLEQVSVEELAGLVKADAVLLKYYNVLEDRQKLRKGDWVLVPRHR